MSETISLAYIVAELLKGEELRDRLDHGSIPLRKVMFYAADYDLPFTSK